MLKEKIEILKLRRKGIKLLKIDNFILTYYRERINNNKDKSVLDTRKCLTRNYILGKEIYRNKNLVIRSYGNLDITVDLKKFRVVNLENHKGDKQGWINKEEKERLNKLFNIRGEING